MAFDHCDFLDTIVSSSMHVKSLSKHTCRCVYINYPAGLL